MSIHVRSASNTGCKFIQCLGACSEVPESAEIGMFEFGLLHPSHPTLAVHVGMSGTQPVSTGVLCRKASLSICLTRKSATSARETNPHVQWRGSTNAR